MEFIWLKIFIQKIKVIKIFKFENSTSYFQKIYFAQLGDRCICVIVLWGGRACLLCHHIVSSAKIFKHQLASCIPFGCYGDQHCLCVTFFVCANHEISLIHFSYHLCVPKFRQLYFQHIKTIGNYLFRVKGDSHHVY